MKLLLNWALVLGMTVVLCCLALAFAVASIPAILRKRFGPLPN